MNKAKRNSLWSMLLLVGILPSLLGVHVFEHFCNGCKGSEFSASLISSVMITHECPACECEHGCKECYQLTGKHVHHATEKDCTHQYKKLEDDFQVCSEQISFKAAEVELLLPAWTDSVLDETVFKNHLYAFRNVILKVPVDPSPEKNCVFLL